MLCDVRKIEYVLCVNKTLSCTFTTSSELPFGFWDSSPIIYLEMWVSWHFHDFQQIDLFSNIFDMKRIKNNSQVFVIILDRRHTRFDRGLWREQIQYESDPQPYFQTVAYIDGNGSVTPFPPGPARGEFIPPLSITVYSNKKKLNHT